jgi:hypothetical protein
MFGANKPRPDDENNELRHQIVNIIRNAGRSLTTAGDISRVQSCADPVKLHSFKAHVLSHNVYMIGNTVDALRDAGQDIPAEGVTRAQVDAMQTFHAMLADNPETSVLLAEFVAVRSRFVTHPDDVGLMSAAIQRGFYTLKGILDMVDLMKQSTPSLAEGTL